MNRLCGAGRVRAVGDRLKRSVPTAASRQIQQRPLLPSASRCGLTAPTGPCCSLLEEHEPADGLRCPTTWLGARRLLERPADAVVRGVGRDEWCSSHPAATGASAPVAAPPTRTTARVRLEAAADRAASKHIGDSRNRGIAGLPVWPSPRYAVAHTKMRTFGECQDMGTTAARALLFGRRATSAIADWASAPTVRCLLLLVVLWGSDRPCRFGRHRDVMDRTPRASQCWRRAAQ